MSKFEGEQKLILESEHKNQLVSAGAGSGKTTIMVEKIARLLLLKKVKVENLLVVTFTVLAAKEMKDRLVERLKEELLIANETKQKEILNIIENIDTASIDTIDGFNSKTIKKYFYALQISPNIEIISDATKDYYLSKAMKITFDDFVKNYQNVEQMLDYYGGTKRNFENLQQLIKNTYNSIIGLDDYEQFLNDAVEEYKSTEKSQNIILEEIKNKSLFVEIQIKNNFCFFDDKTQKNLEKVLNLCKKIKKSQKFLDCLQLFKDFEQIKFTTTDYKQNEGLKDLNANIKTLFEYIDELNEKEINEKIFENNKKILEYLQIFVEILKNFIKNYSNLKQKNNLIDFNDLNKLMIELLKNNEIKTELQNKFKYIFIDEYQDVNALQNKLISNLVGEQTKVFMVGDVKQSIYGFRGATPESFVNKYDLFKEQENLGKTFVMNANYRSSEKVLHFVNVLFSKLMNKKSADIDYEKDCIIDAKRKEIVDIKPKIFVIPEDDKPTIATGVYSVKNHINDNKISVAEKESFEVLKIITENVGTNFYDAKLEKERKLTYKDFAILTYSDKDAQAQVLTNILKANAIPLNLTNKIEIEQSEGVKLIISILKCANNTFDDVDLFATFMCLTNLTIDDITSFRNCEHSFYENLVENINNEEIKSGFEKINQVKTASLVSTNKQLIHFILDKLKVRYFLLQTENGEKEIQLVEEFLNKLSPIEDSLSVAEFIEVVQSNVNKSGDFESKDNFDSVTLQTIHKSKGLEYPVVILFNTGKSFAYTFDNESINFNAEIGLGLDYFDEQNRRKTNSIVKQAIQIKNAEKGYKEALRLLYVALTRAKNKLFITGSCSPKVINQAMPTKNCYINLILSCFAGQIDETNVTSLPSCDIEIVEDVDIEAVNQKTNYNVKNIAENFKYNGSAFNIPFKNTVTNINAKQNEQKSFKLKEVLTPETQYEVEDKSTIGTHYHAVLEQLDFYEEFKVDKKFEDVDYDLIKKAYNTIKQLVKNSIKVKKEAEFMMYVPHKEIVEDGVEDKVLIQGVVDLIVERENTIDIVDYKFSKLPTKILKEKYAQQLKLYKQAVELAFNKKVEKTYIYSIERGELL